MLEVAEIIIAGVVVYVIGLPLVNLFARWKKEVGDAVVKKE